MLVASTRVHQKNLTAPARRTAKLIAIGVKSNQVSIRRPYWAVIQICSARQLDWSSAYAVYEG